MIAHQSTVLDYRSRLFRRFAVPVQKIQPLLLLLNIVTGLASNVAELSCSKFMISGTSAYLLHYVLDYLPVKADLKEAHLPCVERVTKPSFGAASAFSALEPVLFFLLFLQFPFQGLPY
ncbi:MAG: hypothetical protein HGB36_13325 [Chlorobiaceae bacterium]|nr:hypothetical protein [Chlorobiaceae bacterium]